MTWKKYEYGRIKVVVSENILLGWVIIGAAVLGIFFCWSMHFKGEVIYLHRGGTMDMSCLSNTLVVTAFWMIVLGVGYCILKRTVRLTYDTGCEVFIFERRDPLFGCVERSLPRSSVTGLKLVVVERPADSSKGQASGSGTDVPVSRKASLSLVGPEGSIILVQGGDEAVTRKLARTLGAFFELPVKEWEPRFAGERSE